MFHQKKDDWNKFDKSNVKLLLMFCMLKKEKYIFLLFQNITQIVKNKFLF